MRRFAVAACVLVLSACGVSSQDEPQLIEESTQPAPTATPSFDTQTSSPPGSESEAVTPSSPTPSSSAPGLSEGAG